MSKSGTVYKLCCIDTDITEEYVGSTQNFNRRRITHKSYCNNEKLPQYNYYVYQFIRENGGWDNWRMIQLEVVNYETRRDLEAFERKWIERLKPKLNKQIPTRTIQEWYEQNKDKIKDKKKNYREQNKDKIKEQNKQYREQNKDKIKEKNKQYNKQNKDKMKEIMKEYREQNKDKIKEKMKEWYEQNKDKILEQQKEYQKQRVKCIYCDDELRKDSLPRHNKTGRHIYNYIYY